MVSFLMNSGGLRIFFTFLIDPVFSISFQDNLLLQYSFFKDSF
jgi:hypothetical protein